MRFLILLASGPNWKKNLAFHNQPFMPEHAVYVQQAFDKGDVVMAGPFMDFSGGAVVFDAETEEDVIAFAENDPAIKNGIFSFSIKEWGFRMSKFENINPQYGQEYIDIKHKQQKELGIL